MKLSLLSKAKTLWKELWVKMIWGMLRMDPSHIDWKRKEGREKQKIRSWERNMETKQDHMEEMIWGGGKGLQNKTKWKQKTIAIKVFQVSGIK